MIKIVSDILQKAGGSSSLAKQLGIKHTAFYAWKRVPAERVLEIEKITGITRFEMRPDLYPIEIRKTKKNKQKAH